MTANNNTTTATAPDKATIVGMLQAWVKQRPGLEWANYGDASSYRSELRGITRDRHIAEQLLSFVAIRDSITAADMLAGFRSFSGRLTLEESKSKPGRWELSYCTGQYWPTEYRRAACAVLSSVIWDYFRSNIPADETEAAALFRRNKCDNAGDYLRKTCAREFGRTIGARFFN